ncbi:MAG: GGDEF domain-containing protein [Burkholderiaceae bacterium]
MKDPTGDSEGAPTLPPAALRPRSRARPGHIPRNIGRIEPWVGASLATCTGWVLLTAHAGRSTLWLFLLFASAMAIWAWKQPARRQGVLFARALALAVLGFAMLLQAADDPLGAGGPFFYWVAMPPIFYAFLLGPLAAVGVLGANVAAYGLAVLLDGVPADMGALTMRTGVLVIFAGAAVRMGYHLRRTDEILESRRLDADSGLLNEYGFLDHGAELWADCRRSGIPISLALIEAPELRRIRDRQGAEAARVALDHLAGALLPMDSGRNVVARLSMLRFAVIVPGIARPQMEALLAANLGSPARVEVADEALDAVLNLSTFVVDSHLQGISFRNFYEAERQVFETASLEREAANRLAAANDFTIVTGGGAGSDAGSGPESETGGPDTVPLELKA